MKAMAAVFVLAVVTTTASGADSVGWHPAKCPLPTRWTKEVKPETAHREYPRPQMVRKEWLNLNGLWDFAVEPKDSIQPVIFPDKILVPFPVESALSGVMKRLDETRRVWYRRTVSIPRNWKGKHVLLHFGAADWETTVWVNGILSGMHKGGYDPFTFDITPSLKTGEGQEIVVSVWDPTDTFTQPHGKQVKTPWRYLYTPTTGIWQTVWMEPVPEDAIAGIKIVPDIDEECVRVTVDCGGKVRLSATEDSRTIAGVSGEGGKEIDLSIPHAKLWSPSLPYLYGLDVLLLDANGKPIDRVQSYFGMRKISVGKDAAGVTRILLNNEFIFEAGPLDQGYWPDGLYAAPTDAALRYDIEATKSLGFNMARKHMKVESARWYYWCDKLGLLVWQDMPGGDASKAPVQFETELKAMVEANINSPSIVMWTVFNENYGQHDTVRYVKLVRSWDPSRLVNNASGGIDMKCGDVLDFHIYPGPGSPVPEEPRAAVLGEFGGLGLRLAGHLWQQKDNWDYQTYPDRDKLTQGILGLYRKLPELIASPGLSAAVYTQTTDVEAETNGFMTYDRAMIKGDVRLIRDEVNKVYVAASRVCKAVR